jgi:ankyrin repeat protein
MNQMPGTPLVTIGSGGEGENPRGADIDSACTPEELFRAAVTFADLATVKAAYQPGLDLEERGEDGNTLLLSASLSNLRRDVAQFLIDKGANILAKNDYGETCLHGFSRSDWCDLIEKALDAGCDIEAPNYPDTALSLACQEDALDAVRLLIQRGAKPFLTRDDDSTSLLLSTPRAVAVSCAAGLSVDTATEKGMTMLMHASAQDNWELCESIIAQGAALDVADKRGWPAVAHAALDEAPRCLAALLNAGASTDFRTAENETFEQLLAGCKSEIRAVYHTWKARESIRRAFKTNHGATP